MNTDAIVVILGRAGSKGCRNKNTRMLAGMPVHEHTVRWALEQFPPSMIVECTDYSIRAKRRWLRRPPELATDEIAISAVLRYIFEHVDVRFIIVLYACVPIRPQGIAREALRLLETSGCDSVQSYCPVGKFHAHWQVGIFNKNEVVWQDPPIHRRQDLAKLYAPDGGVLAVTRESLFNPCDDTPHGFLGQDRRAIITEPGSVVDIDTEADFRLAEALLSHEHQRA